MSSDRLADDLVRAALQGFELVGRDDAVKVGIDAAEEDEQREARLAAALHKIAVEAAEDPHHRGPRQPADEDAYQPGRGRVELGERRSRAACEAFELQPWK